MRSSEGHTRFVSGARPRRMMAPTASEPVGPSSERRRVGRLEGCVWGLCLVLIVCMGLAVRDAVVHPTGAVAGLIAGLPGLPFEDPFAGKQQIAILLVGTDDAADLTDTLILVLINRTTKRIGLISLPRDLLVENPRGEAMKINAVVPTTQRRSGTTIRDGVRDLEQTLARTFGIVVDGFVRIDVKAFVELVDYLGGVDLEVPRGPHGTGLQFKDPSQNLFIDLRPGKQHMDGYNAMGFVRWRKDQCKEEHGDGEPGRNARQRAFLQEVASKVAGKLSQHNWEAAATAASLAAIAHSHVTTDLDVRQIMAVAQIAREVNSAGIEGTTAPVKGQRNSPPLGFVYFADPVGTQQLVRDTWLKLSGEKALAAIAKTEILNGCGKAGIADQAKQQLAKLNAHVVRTGNAVDGSGRPVFSHPKTVIRCTAKFARAGKQIAAAIGLPDAEVREDLADDRDVDVSVILGSDYRPPAA